ncbi:hypothetical protein JST97_00545 [bacterium]|nr:hypothetical protein [bacterium]
MSTSEQQEAENQALDFLEQWLSGSGQDSSPQPVVEAPRSLDPSLRAIERLVTQHRELFRRHAQSK